MQELKFTFETIESYNNAEITGELEYSPFNIVRFVVKKTGGYTVDFPVKSREEALQLAVTIKDRGDILLNVYECTHMEENKQRYEIYE